MIIGLSGYAQSGKDTVADYLVKNYGFKKMSFASPIREALYRLNPKVDIADMRGVSLAAAVDGLGWENVKADSPDARELLQRFGTEVGREMFGEDFWIRQAINKIERDENVVFADVRFQNEADIIKADGGSVWRIQKPGVEAVNKHESESALDSYTFDAGLNNFGTVEDLHQGVDAIMNNYLGMTSGLVAQLVRATDS